MTFLTSDPTRNPPTDGTTVARTQHLTPPPPPPPPPPPTHHIGATPYKDLKNKPLARARELIHTYESTRHRTTKPRPALDAFVAQLNVITKRFNTLAARHRHKKGGKSGDGETSGEEDAS